MLINVEGKRKQTHILNLKYYYKPNTKLCFNSKVKNSEKTVIYYIFHSLLNT